MESASVYEYLCFHLAVKRPTFPVNYDVSGFCRQYVEVTFPSTGVGPGTSNAGQRLGFGIGELRPEIAALAFAICSRQFGIGELFPFTFR